MKPYRDRVAIITGAASGIGLLAAQRFACEGAKIVLTDVNREGVEAAAEGIRQHGAEAIRLVVVVRNHDRIKAAVDHTVEKDGDVDIYAIHVSGRTVTFPLTHREHPLSGAPTPRQDTQPSPRAAPPKMWRISRTSSQATSPVLSSEKTSLSMAAGAWA